MARPGRRISTALVALVVGFAAASVLETGSALAADGAQTPAADELFRQAVALAKRKAYAEAVEKFRASYALDPARGTLQGLALAEEMLGRTASAYMHYRELVDLAKAAGDTKREAAASARVAALETKVPRLTLIVPDTPAVSEMSLDSSPLPKGAFGTALPVDPGEHRIVGKAADGSTFERAISIAEGQSAKVEVTWRAQSTPKESSSSVPAPTTKEPEPAPRDRPHSETSTSSSSLSTVGLVTGGVGLVVLGVSAFVYVSAQSDIDDSDSRCPDRTCTDAELVEQGNDARNRKSLGFYGLIGGGVLFGAGVTLFVVGQGQRRSPSAVRASVGPPLWGRGRGAGMLRISGEFR